MSVRKIKPDCTVLLRSHQNTFHIRIHLKCLTIIVKIMCSIKYIYVL